MIKKILAAATLMYVSLCATQAFAEPVSGTYKLISETIRKDAVCISPENSGIYFGADPSTVLKYDQKTHTMTFSNAQSVIAVITLNPVTSSGHYEKTFNRPNLTGKITMDAHAPLSGNSFQVTMFSQLTSGQHSQKCSNIAGFSL